MKPKLPWWKGPLMSRVLIEVAVAVLIAVANSIRPALKKRKQKTGAAR